MIRIILVDDHGLVRAGVQSVIKHRDDIVVIAEANNGREAVAACVEKQPDVVIMDIGMPDMNGIEATRLIRRDCPQAKVIALSMHSDKRYVAEMLKVGAAGYLMKDCASEELVSAIQTVLKGDRYLSPKLSNILAHSLIGKETAKEEQVFEVLSGREREILQLIAEGFTSKEIADKLFISNKTVDTHKKNIMERTNTNSVAGLTRYAIRAGISPLE